MKKVYVLSTFERDDQFAEYDYNVIAAYDENAYIAARKRFNELVGNYSNDDLNVEICERENVLEVTFSNLEYMPYIQHVFKLEKMDVKSSECEYIYFSYPIECFNRYLELEIKKANEKKVYNIVDRAYFKWFDLDNNCVCCEEYILEQLDAAGIDYNDISLPVIESD
jgi:lantibiotic modifying enzyme